MENEKRLIDANALKLLFRDRYDRAFMQMHSREEREYWDGVCCGVNWGVNTITDAPTVDAVEVVRCDECVHYEAPEDGDFLGRCTSGILAVSHGGEIYPGRGFFCPYGERKSLARAPSDPAEAPGVRWSRPGPCPITPEQFEAIYNDEGVEV